MTGEFQEALEYQERPLAEAPDSAYLWVLYGKTLRTVGRLDESIAAYRKAIALQPEYGEPWWCLADLKTFRFEPDDIETMIKLLDDDDGSENNRSHLHFALGKALEDRGAYAESFQHYRKGNAIRRAGLHHSPDLMSELVRYMKALFTREFFD